MLRGDYSNAQEKPSPFVSHSKRTYLSNANCPSVLLSMQAHEVFALIPTGRA